jgi:hypothetical protein
VAGDFGGFSGVFGQVTSDGSIGECAGEGHRADIELGSPGQGPAVGIGRVWLCGEAGGGDGTGEGLIEIGCGDSRWRGRGVSGWVGSRASRRSKAWKWMSPRAWYSATLANARRSVTPWVLPSLARARLVAMVVRRHSSEAQVAIPSNRRDSG